MFFPPCQFKGWGSAIIKSLCFHFGDQGNLTNRRSSRINNLAQGRPPMVSTTYRHFIFKAYKFSLLEEGVKLAETELATTGIEVVRHRRARRDTRPIRGSSLTSLSATVPVNPWSGFQQQQYCSDSLSWKRERQ